MRAEHVFGFGENVFDKGAGNDAQSDFAVDTAESQVVDLVPKRRDVWALTGVHIDRENVVAAGVEVRCKVEGKGCVPAFVFAEARAVDPDGGRGHYAFEVDEDVASGGFSRHLEAAAVEGDEFVGLLVEAMPGQAH